MSVTQQHKVLRLFKGPNTGADWHARQGNYTKDEITSIPDPAEGARKEITSIPSPFARIHLFENAFDTVANMAINRKDHRLLLGKTAYHQLVSDALDVAEVFFNADLFARANYNFRYVIWNKEKDLKALKNSQSHKLFGETLELFLNQDKKKTHFDKIENFCLLYCNHILIGGTSPSTLFFAAHNEKFRLKDLNLRQGNDVFFDAEPCPLYHRAPSFQRYLYGLFELNPQLKQQMKPFSDYLTASLTGLKADYPKLWDELQNEVFNGNITEEKFKKEFAEATTGKENASIHVIPNVTHRRRIGDTLDYKNDDFAIKSTKYTKGKMPLVLQNGFQKTLSYCKGKWQPDFKVPFNDPNPLEKRVLPGTSEPYPYLTVGDFLEPYLMRVPYPIESEWFHTGNPSGFVASNRQQGKPGDDGFLLPLTKAFFDFFDPEFLDATTSDNKPCFQISKKEKDEVEVSLRIPINSGDYILFSRTYRPNQPPKTTATENEGSISKCSFDLGFLPMFFAENPDGSKNVQQLAVLADGDILPATRQRNYSFCFYKKDGTQVMPAAERPRQDKNRHANYVTTKHYLIEEHYDFAVISNTEQTGLLLPKWRQKQRGNKAVTVAVDFGTTNTYAALSFDRGEVMPFEFGTQEKLLVTLSEDWIEGPILKEVILKTLTPYRIGKGEECSTPVRTVISEIKGINHSQSVAGADASIAFFFETRYLLKDEDWFDDLKWKRTSDDADDTNRKRVEAFLGQLLFLVRNQIIANGGDLDKTTLVWTLPSSLGVGQSGGFTKVWKKVVEKQLGPKAAIRQCSESLSPYYSYGRQVIKGGKYPVVNVDIGGGTTDTVIFLEDKPLYSSSFRFAGNTVFGNGFGEQYDRSNGLVSVFAHHFEGWLASNKDKMPRLSDKYEKDCKGMGSANLASFFFSIETNKEVRDARVDPISFTDFLAGREDTKVVFIVFFGAIFYHQAKLMKQLELGMPRQIAFSGKASGMLRLLDEQPNLRSATTFARLIFEKVYEQPYHSDGLELLCSDNPKERTCIGAVRLASLGKEPDEPQTAILLGDEGQTVLLDNDKLKYSDVNNPTTVASVEKELRQFFDFIFELNKEFNYAQKFGALAGQKLLNCKDRLTADLQTNLKTGLALRGETTEQTEPVVETLFFYPLTGSLHQLMQHFSSL